MELHQVPSRQEWRSGCALFANYKSTGYREGHRQAAVDAQGRRWWAELAD